MGLRGTFQKLAQSARSAFGDLFETVAYVQQLDQPTIDTNGATQPFGATPTALTSRAAFTGYTDEEIAESQGVIVHGDEKCVIAALDLSVRPKPGDLIQRDGARAANRVRAIVNVRNAGGADALWVLQVRPYVDAWPVA